MRQRLREVAEQRTAFYIDLFRVQTDVVAAREEFLEKLSRFGNTSAEGQSFDQPEAAGEKCAFARRQTVIGAHFIAIQKIVAPEPLPNRLDRAEHPRIVWLEKTDARDVQQTGIELVTAENRDETLQLLTEPLLHDDTVDFLFSASPRIDAIARNEFLVDQPQSAVKRYPGHDFAVDVMRSLGSFLPDSVVRFRPLLRNSIGHAHEQCLDVTRELRMFFFFEMLLDRAEDLAVNVELQLIACSVAGANWSGAAITLELQRFFPNPRFAEDVVENLQAGMCQACRIQDPMDKRSSLGCEAAIVERGNGE